MSVEWRAVWPGASWALLLPMVRRDAADRYRGHGLGRWWWVLTPLLMVLVYTVVLRHAMGVRWSGGAAIAATGWEGDVQFALRLLCGLLPFQWLADVVGRSPRLILEQPHLVKKVVFPLELLPWMAVLTAGVPLLVGTALVVGVQWTLGVLGSLGSPGSNESLHWTVLALPLVWLSLLPLLLGLGWLLAAVGTFLRDVAVVVPPILGGLLFLSPIFFDLQGIDPRLAYLLSFNPLAAVIQATRALVLDGVWPSWVLWQALGWSCLSGVAVAAVGLWVFQRTRRGFADVV